MLKILAPAKINWFLEIVRKRDDGFHEIDTVMQSINLFDEITVEDAPALSLHCSIDLGPVEHNLAFKAAALLQSTHAPSRGARITLSKHIPHGAGLGGGSSDAAATLVALNRLWDLRLEPGTLRELAARIGSDCAFFVEGGMARCTGRGEIVQPLPDAADIDLVILYPDEVCPTGPVYADAGSHLTGERNDCYFFHVAGDVSNRTELASRIFNRLQPSALRVSARLLQAWGQTATERGVLARFVSGSGSSIAFLMPDEQSANVLAAALRDRGLGQAFAARTLPRGVVWG